MWSRIDQLCSPFYKLLRGDWNPATLGGGTIFPREGRFPPASAGVTRNEPNGLMMKLPLLPLFCWASRLAPRKGVLSGRRR
jgi:hypothetical protein